MTRKSGPLSKADKEFIINQVDSMPPDAIAECIDRNPKSVINYIETNKLGQKYSGTAPNSDKTQTEIYKELKGKPFFKQLEEQFNEDEIKYFCDYWVLTVNDFGGNILSYEELELKGWLTFEILKSRLLKQTRLNTIMKNSYKDQLELEFKYDRDQRDKDRIVFLQGEIRIIDEQQVRHNKEYADLADKADKIKKGLVQSRDQRTKDLDSAQMDFTAWIKILNKDYDARKRVGHEMEILRIAEEQKKDELYKLREFVDGEVDVPVLNAESVRRIEAENG